MKGAKPLITPDPITPECQACGGHGAHTTAAVLLVASGSRFDEDYVTRQNPRMEDHTAKVTIGIQRDVLYHVQAAGLLGPLGRHAGETSSSFLPP